MSNKITLATIQFRADTKGVNPALDTMRQSSKDAHDEVDRLQEALDKGIKKMKDANGVEFDVADKFRQAQKAAKSYDQALRELVKGATALETVVQNIRLGEIEKSSRAELKGAINAAEARKRSVRESDPEDLEQQRDLNKVIEESRKQLNNLDRDTQKVIETLDKGGVIAQATLDKEIKGLKEILTLIPKGTDEWNKYNQQLTQMEAHMANIRRQEREAAVSVLGSKNFGRYTEEEIRTAITNARELLATYKTASPEAKALADNIVRADQYLKEHGIEAARQAARQAEELRQEKELRKVMNGRMKDLTTLSASALEETKKYWQAQRDGAEQGSRAFKVAEKNLKAVNDRQAELTAKQNSTMARQLLKQGNLQTMSEGDIRRAIEAAKQYQQTLSTTDTMYKRLTKAIVDAEEHIKQYGIEAERAARKDAAAQQQLADKHKLMQDRMQNLRNLSQGGLEETRKYWQAQMDGAERSSKAYKEAEKNLRAIADEQKRLSTEQLQQSAKRLGTRNLSSMSEQELQASIAAAKQLAATMQPTDQAYKQLIADILRAEQHVKQFGIEAERSNQQAAALATTMNKRMSNLKSLSVDALAETKKYWEAQKAGAAEGTAEFNKAEAALKKIANLETRRKRDSLDSILGDPSKHGVAEVREAVREMEQLRDSVQKGTPAWLHYNKMVEQGREYLDRLAKSEAADHIEQQMQKIDKLSASGLQEVKKYWEAMVAGAEHGSAELDQYRQKLERVTQEERERAAITAQKQSASILSGNYTNMSESELRSAIEAAKQYQQTLKTGDTLHKDYSEAIVKAENYLHQFGLEEERVAQKRKETDRLMKKQLTEMTNQMAQHNDVSVDVLKSQHQYWQKLIDDPKNAGKNLQEYEDNLREVERLQRRMVGKQGQEAFDFFQRGDHETASMGEVKQQAEALKKWRDTLPQKTHADTIAKINEYLEQAGMSAKKAAEQTMSWKQAMQVSSQAGKGSFKGSIEQLTQAKKVLEEMSAKAVKGGLAWRRMQEALQRIGVELKNVGHLSQEVQSVLDSPKGRSFNALKQAVEQGRLALNAMDRTTKEGQRAFDELAKKVKAADQEMKQLAATSKGTSTAFEKAWSRVKTYVGVYVGTAVAMQKVTATMGDLMDLSDKMGEVRKTTQMTADEVGRLSENLKKMDVRTSLTSLMEISASAGQLGLKTLEDVQGFTEAANKLMIALPEMGREAATEMMRVAIATGEVDKIRKQLQEGTIEGSSATAVAMEKIASTIDRLRASSASTAPEITDFVKRVGAVGAQSGITIDQVAALGSTVSSLGMRIEMSATALSRMIPAIRNNAFELAKAIGVTPDTIRNLFDTGRGMEVILMILQRIKDTGMDADSVEQMLGMAGMRDIMKDLNQQGARAGIVFSGLSQNVDELRRQLGVAGEAYEENIAIQQEFDKMNETTAAKWERLKNAFEEMFVGDEAQRFLGGVIDGLRNLIDLIAGPLRNTLLVVTVTWGAFKMGIGSAVASAITALHGFMSSLLSTKASVDGLRASWAKLELATKQNIFGALIAVLGIVVAKVAEWRQAVAEQQKELGRWAQDIIKSEQAVEKNFKAIDKANESITEANKKLSEAQTELKRAKEAMDGSKESADRLTKAEKDLKKAEDDVKIANDAHRSSIEQINRIYGQYLGFMLSEISSAAELANARELINSKLRETITLKRKEAALGRVEQDMGEDRDKAYGDLSQSLNGAIRRQVDIGNGKKGWATDEKATADLLRQITKVTQDANITREQAAKQIEQILIDAGKGGEQWKAWRAGIRNRALEYQKEYQKVQKKVQEVETQFDVQASLDREESQQRLDQQFKEADKTYASLIQRHANAQGDARRQAAADLLKQSDTLQEMVKNAPNYYDLTNAEEKASYDKFVSDSQARIDGIEEQRDALLKEAGNLYQPRNTVGGGMTTSLNTNPWGTSERADSTTYTEMTAEQLVNRRDQMNKFVNSLQTDTDVKAVLNEDKALKKAIEAGMSSDMRTVIEWYNTERLKIQDELHARHLTNTGDWLDPKKERGAKKQFRDEMDAYLHELDAYYTERKTRIEQARNDEEITEGEAWRRTIQNDNEWQTRRAELQKLYSRKQQEVTKEELDAIIRIIAERTGDSESFVKAAIAKTNQFVDAIEKSGDKGAAIVHRWMSQVVLDTERSYLKAAQAIGKQMKFIEETLAKERPYDGITKNLQDNLDKMGVLAAKYRRENEELARQNKGPKYSNEQITAQSYDEMAFYLRQAADAYSIDIDELLRRMVKEGMTATAEEISKSDMLKQAVMGQLRKTYQEVQDAVKKEASQIKKDVEIIWNDDARGIGGMSMKATFDKALAQLGMQQDSVSRANSLIGAGAASDNVASRLAMKQIEVQMRMQKAQYDMYRVQANQRMAALKAEAKEHQRIAELEKQAGHEAAAAEQRTKAMVALRDAENVRLSLGLTLAEETKNEEQQKAELLKIQEERQNRLYTSLREWADLLTSSLQGVMEASHAGDAEYYNERAKLDLTGKGGPGAGTYVVIDDAGTSDAKAHYEYLDERQALERQHEIEVQNAQAEAWRKLMDDLNMKMSEQITDWMNAYLQNKATEDNTAELQRLQQKLEAEQLKMDASVTATDANTQAVQGLTQQLAEGITIKNGDGTDGNPAYQEGGNGQIINGGNMGVNENGVPIALNTPEETAAQPGYGASWQQPAQEQSAQGEWLSPMQPPTDAETYTAPWAAYAQASTDATKKVMDNDKKATANAQSGFAKMTAAANLYGLAYQTMSNDNLSTAQKVQLFAVQAAGNAAIAMLTTDMATTEGEAAVSLPGILGKAASQLGPIAGPIAFAAMSALLGGLMGLAVSKIAKSKSTIAQATGASVSAGRLATGMLTYAEGNVNELTDPASLTPGRRYNVDGADGKTYRARYMGKGAKTHITNGPEFHLVGEAGREAIIDAKTTRLLQLNETGIWRDIQTLYNGGSISGMASRRRRGGGVAAFAEGNIGEFEDAMGGDNIAANGTGGGMSVEMLASLQASIDRQSDLLENALVNGIKAVNKWTGSDGIPAMYNKMQKEAQRHGEKYL